MVDIYSVPESERHELLERVRQAVPRVTIQNGMEATSRFALPQELPAKSSIRAAAEILELGELEALVDGEPPRGAEVWNDALRQAQSYLDRAEAEGEITSGSSELSRFEHIRSAREALSELNLAMRLNEENFTSSTDKAWAADAFSEVAYIAYMAGRRVQVAWGKPIERDAYLLQQDRASRSQGGSSKHR